MPKVRLNARWFLPALLVLSCLGNSVRATDPWPGEPWTSASIYTGLDSDFQANMSGASWNPITRTFWVCCNNPGTFWALEVTSSGALAISTDSLNRKAKFAVGGDLESVTQAEFSENAVYVMDEPNFIRKYGWSQYGTANLIRTWDIAPYIPAYTGGLGSEGICFVPDASLAAGGFVDSAGLPRQSQLGMGGLMFVAHQNGGRIYVFDLNPNTTQVNFVGSYLTSQTESSGLEFDRATHRLYIWHNTGSNYLEVVNLSSTLSGGNRTFNQVAEYFGPKTGNLEGIAPAFGGNLEGGFLCCDDSNQDGAAVMLFHWFLRAYTLPATPYHISEILMNPPGADSTGGLGNEYVELTGPANAAFPAGTYLVGIEGDAPAGDVQTIFNLSGLTFGSNGVLLLLQPQDASPYTVDPAAHTITATGTNGWNGLAGYSADGALPDIEHGSVTFLLVNAPTPPALTDDIDANNDSQPDGTVYNNWTILDAIGIRDNTGGTDAAYAPLIYAEDVSGTSIAGATTVLTTGTANWVARVPGSTGFATTDWVAGGLSGTDPNWTLTVGDTYPSSFGGTPLNHLGGANGNLPVELSEFTVE